MWRFYFQDFEGLDYPHLIDAHDPNPRGLWNLVQHEAPIYWDLSDCSRTLPIWMFFNQQA